MKRAKILLMDDDTDYLRIVALMLEHLGFAWALSSTGEEAVGLYSRAKADGRPFDVVVLDMVVKYGMGGLETARQLRSLDPCVKLVLSSGHSDGMSAAEVRSCGFDSNLPKPFRITELKKAVLALTGGKGKKRR